MSLDRYLNHTGDVLGWNWYHQDIIKKFIVDLKLNTSQVPVQFQLLQLKRQNP